MDEIMGITLGQRKRSIPIESSTQVGLGARSTRSLATPLAFGSPLDLALNTQKSVKNSASGLDIAQASQNSEGKYFTLQFKVSKPVPMGTTLGGVQGALNSAATIVPLADREVPKVRAAKELCLKKKELTPQVDETKETNSLPEKYNNAGSLPILESSKETFVDDKDTAEGKLKSAKNSNLLPPQETPKSKVLDGKNSVRQSSKKAIMAEGKEHALAIRYTKMSAKDMYGSLHRLMSGLAVDFLCGDLGRWLGWAAVVRW